MSPHLWRAAFPTVAAIVALTGCGGSGDGGGTTVADVQGTPITKSALTHWTNVKRLELAAQSPPSGTGEPGAQRAALAFLITADWLEGEAAVQGLHVADADLKASYRSLLGGQTGTSFAASLRRRAMSEADELRLLRLGALASKLRAKVAQTERTPLSQSAIARIAAFQAGFRQRWKLRTTCRPRYVIAECREGPALGASGGGE